MVAAFYLFPPMVPVLPFAFLFAAIVEAQAPECYTLSDMFLGLPGCLAPKPPELSIQHFYPPDMELNADVWGWGRKEYSKPRMPPYTTRSLVVIPQACAPKANEWGGLETPERLPSGRCENDWDGYPLKSDAAAPISLPEPSE